MPGLARRLRRHAGKRVLSDDAAMLRRRFALALVLSVLLHFVVVAGPGWQVPSHVTQEEATTVEARLVSPAPPQAARPIMAPSAKATPPRHRAPLPRRGTAPRTPQVTAATEAPVVAAAQPSQQPAAAGGTSTGGDAAATAAAPAAAATDDFEVPLPGEGRIRFDVMLGSSRFVVGESVTTWHLDQKAYSIRNVAETTGLVSLFKRAKVTQTSAGEVSAKGLVPREYTMVRNDSGQPSEGARFDWVARKITLLRDGQPHDAELLDGSYDILSLVYQFAWFPPQASALEIPVATGKSYYRQKFAVLGEERISLRLGLFRTLHLRVGQSGDNITDIWLALDYKNLPLRIRHSAKNGDTFEQEASDVRYGEVKLLLPPKQPLAG